MPEPQNVVVRTEPIEGGFVVSLKGDIDFSRSPDLRIQLMKVLDRPLDRLILDLGGVPYMDSSGVAVLVETLQVQRKRGKKLVLCHMQPKVQGIFEIAQLHRVFNIARDVAAAAQV